MFGFRWHILRFANSRRNGVPCIAFWAPICWAKVTTLLMRIFKRAVTLCMWLWLCHWRIRCHTYSSVRSRISMSREMACLPVHNGRMDSILSAFGNSFSFRLLLLYYYDFFGSVRLDAFLCVYLPRKWIYLVFSDAALCAALRYGRSLRRFWLALCCRRCHIGHRTFDVCAVVVAFFCRFYCTFKNNLN